MSENNDSNGRNLGEFCDCCLRAQRNCSWTHRNPGRRFYGCRNWQNAGCNYFRFIDPPMTERAREVILQLIGERDVLLERVETLRDESNRARRLQFILFLSWAFFLAFWFH
ncbi:hypothetical protein OROMI_011657 [Orobanche minor]